ncbi:integrase core domain-containing protein [Aporhodopirellula aestuarii]|uniref:integrase core domain-containing protein n=1 Tax=Aporhodopirellula aestuarii TaxID=2950107 RepID=UPI0038993B50
MSSPHWSIWPRLQAAQLDLRRHWPRVHLKSFYQCAYDDNVTLDFNRPEKPTDNALIESSDGGVRAECQNEKWSLSLDEPMEKIEAWQVDYNEHRPHSVLAQPQMEPQITPNNPK